MSYTRLFFDRIADHLAQRPDHTARVVFGAACEQWISSEAFAVLNWNGSPIPSDTHVLCECRKRDITLFTGLDSSAEALATVECKVVHPNKNLESNLATLRAQLRKTAMSDETTATEYGALIYAVWADWFERRDTKEEKVFHSLVNSTLHRLFEPETFSIAPAHGLRAIVESRPVEWRGEFRSVSLYGACAARKPQVP